MDSLSELSDLVKLVKRGLWETYGDLYRIPEKRCEYSISFWMPIKATASMKDCC